METKLFPSIPTLTPLLRHLSISYFGIILIVCLFPTLFVILGFNFDLSQQSSLGAYSHTILEWSAVSVGILTAALAFNHFQQTGDLSAPVIGIALACSAALDAFHTLAAIGLIHNVKDSQDFIPFTWAFSRCANAISITLGACLLLWFSPKPHRHGLQYILIVSFILIAIGYSGVLYSTLSENLPQTQFPNSFITRPYDIAPLFLYVVIGFWLLPQLSQRYSGVFLATCQLSLIPSILVQLHMAFGSSQLFDAHFNIAHALKILAYLIPMLGLMQAQTIAYHKAKKTEELTHLNKKLEASNEELEQFAYIASHDLQEPLRMVSSFCSLLSKRYRGKLDKDADEFIDYAVDGANRMKVLINDLLSYSRIKTQGKAFCSVQPLAVIETIKHDLAQLIEESHAIIEIDHLPLVMGDSTQLRQLFQNLICNAIKFRSDAPPHIHIFGGKKDHFITITVQDNGIGLNPKYCKQVFAIFKRIDREKPGSGIGLALCKRIVERHGGTISLHSQVGEGCRIQFTLPVTISQGGYQ